MLSDDYFDGTRLRAYEELLRQYKNISICGQIPEVTVDISSKEMIDNNLDSDTLIAFSPDVRVVNDSSAIVTYTLNDKDEVGRLDQNKFEVNKIELQKTMYYLSNGDRTILADHQMMIPPCVGEMDDGQLKIATDLVLAVDDMINKDNKDLYKVLVIGSSSPDSAIKSGQSYKMFSEFGKSFIVEMYDPYEIPGETIVTNGNVKIIYRRVRDVFDYSLLSKKHDYDLIMDDSWVEGKYRSVRDSELSVYNAKNFSIKLFPTEMHKGNIYHQKFSTSIKEQRSVSRNVKYFRYKRKLGLGKCAGCRELTMRMHGDFGLGLFKAYMAVHNKNCTTSNFNYILVYSDEINWIEVDPFEFDPTNYCCFNGVDFYLGAEMINPNFDIRGRKLIYTNRGRVLRRSQESSQILVVEDKDGDRRFFVDKVILETVKSIGTTKKKMIDNLTHFTTRATTPVEIRSYCDRLNLSSEYSDRTLRLMFVGYTDEELDKVKSASRSPKFKQLYGLFVKKFYTQEEVRSLILDPNLGLFHILNFE